MKTLLNFILITVACSAVLLIVGCYEAQKENANLTFEKIQLSSTFYAEGAGIGDVNGNGNMDVVCGPFWYEGPDFENRHAYYEPVEIDPLEYSDNFVAAVDDVNGNGLNDILIVGFPGQQAWWYENPGNDGDGYWERHLIHERVDNESPAFKDLTGDGQLELIFHTNGYLGYSTPDRSDPTRPWMFYPVSEQGDWGSFNHGLGIGDITGNGYNDFIMKGGWWENPGSDWEGQTPWTYHEEDFGPGGAQMVAYDVDGDGFNDIITSLEAHGWGLAWYKQIREGESIGFKQQVIMGSRHADNAYGVRFSQPHAVAIADMNHSGSKDIITGKRFWAHGSEGDPEPNAPAVIYIFQTGQNGNGTVDFVPTQVDDNSGVGTQISTGDLTGNGYQDIAACNKKGGFVFLNRMDEN